jgi:hypothetical protein
MKNKPIRIYGATLRSVQRARRIIRNSNTLGRLVFNGKMSLNKAERIIKEVLSCN